MGKNFTIALAGNPNCGKSTVFNQLTGTKQHVGNWPGKTVEKKEGSFQYKGKQITVVDLPGTYSLTAYSLEEVIARDYVIKEKPDLVVSIIDAANIERNLYLTMQLIELGIPVIAALNMMDVVKEREIQIDVEKIKKTKDAAVAASQKLGEEIYKQAQAEQQAKAGAQQNAQGSQAGAEQPKADGKDDVVDAEVVDEEKEKSK